MRKYIGRLLCLAVYVGAIYSGCVMNGSGQSPHIEISLAPHADTVEWLGYPVFARKYSGIDPGFYAGNPPTDIRYEDSLEIGLRSDGIVVWRKKP